VNDAVRSNHDQPAVHSDPRPSAWRAAPLRKNALFQAVRGQGRWKTHRLVAVGVLANGLDVARCGFSVSKRMGNAVARNRARRRLREAVRLHWSKVLPGWDIVVAARDPLRDAAFADIQAAVLSLLQRSQVLQTPQ
jgi:ribonuclease P protein component